MPQPARPSLRLALALLLPVLLPACDRTPPPKPVELSAETPEQMPVATEAPPAPTEAAAKVLLPFSTDDARVGTEIGERSLGLGMRTTGKAGWLLFGPYIPLPAGHYQVELRGAVHAGHAGIVHADVAQSRGAVLLAVAELDEAALAKPASPDGLAVLAFTLTEASHDLEVRVRVTETSNLSIAGYTIRSLP